MKAFLSLAVASPDSVIEYLFDYCMRMHRTPALVDAIMNDPDALDPARPEHLRAVADLMIELNYAGPAPLIPPSEHERAIAALIDSRHDENTGYFSGGYFAKLGPMLEVHNIRIPDALDRGAHNLLEQSYLGLFRISTDKVVAKYFMHIVCGDRFNARLPQTAKLLLHGAGMECSVHYEVKLLLPSANCPQTARVVASARTVITGPRPEYAARLPYISIETRAACIDARRAKGLSYGD